MGNFTVIRDYQKDYTPGELFDNRKGEKFCDTIELKWANNQNKISCIPEGTYHYSIYFSPSLKRKVLLLDLKETAPRSYILVHNGNTILDIEGCCLVGRKGSLVIDGIKYPAVLNSITTLEKLLEIAGTSGTITFKKKVTP